MEVPLDVDDLDPLLTIAQSDPDAMVRVAALDAATRFPLDRQAWQRAAEVNWRIVQDAAPGSPARRKCLALAVRIPLRSLREHLRGMAEDKNEVDRDALATALDEAGDKSRILPLLAQVRSGDAGAFEAMAAMPVEDVLTPSDVPAVTPDDATSFWRALVLARLGQYESIDAFFSGQAPVPDIFYGSPWTAYDAIARVRPIPEPMRAHLLQSLALLDTQPAERQPNYETQRLLQLTVWAVTGIADAEGTLIEANEATKGAPTLTQGSAKQVQEALLLRNRLPKVDFFKYAQDDIDLLKYLPQGSVAALVKDVLEQGNRQAMALDPDYPSPILLGNHIVDLIGRMPVSDDWPVAALAAGQIASERPALADSQLAWVMARAKAGHLIGELAGLLTAQQVSSERLRVMELLCAAADCQGGRASSPMLGAGGAGSTLTGRGELIDDTGHRSARAMAPPKMQEEAMAMAAPDDAGEIEERRVNARILHQGKPRNSFVAGADNIIRCWIGLPEKDSAAADLPIARVDIPPEGLPLMVQLVWRDGSGQDHTDSKQMQLPPGRTARTIDCDLLLNVPAGERYVSAEILFLYKDSLFEAVRVEAFALEANETEGPQNEIRVRVQASRRQVIELPDRNPMDATLVFGDDNPSTSLVAGASGSPILRVFGRKQAGTFDLSDAKTAIQWLNETLFTTEKLVVRRHAAGDAAAQEELDSDDPDVRVLLRDMARHGAGLYNQLIDQGFTDPGDRIQVLNLEPNSYVPIEFIYDRGYPVTKAKLCMDGLHALNAGASACPVCRTPVAADQRSDAPVICVFGFWSLRKVIERIAPEAGGQPSMPSKPRRSLPVIDAVAFASSHLVPEDERLTTQKVLQQSFSQAYLAEDWHQWAAAVKHQPPLLVVLPHHGVQSALDYLEIGDEALDEDLGKLSHAQITPQFVNPDERNPGPIVLLLGCQTAADSDTGYVGITRRIQQQHASIVLGTLAQILGRHAAPLARELVAQLAAVDDPMADFGTIMRLVRRRMLGRGYLMAMCLVALGDAEWRLSPRPALNEP